MPTATTFPARKLTVALALSMMLAGCSQESSTTASTESTMAAVVMTPEQQIDTFFTTFTDRWMEANPNRAVSTAYFEGDKQNMLEQQLTPETMDYELATIALAREGLAELQSLDLASGTPTQRLSAEVMQWLLESQVAAEPYLDYIDPPLNQFGGANVNLVSTFTLNHPMSNPQDAENFVIRLREVDDRMHEATAETARRFAEGINLPTFILNATIVQMERFAANAPDANPIVTTFVQKSSGLTGLEASRRDQLIAEVKDILVNEIYPAWEGGIAQLQSQLASSTDEAGVSRFPNGAAIYQNQLEAYTSTTLTADEIHQIGLNEVARIEAEMDSLFRQLGMTEGTIAERVVQLEQRLAYPNTDEGRATMVADIREILADALERSALLFDKVPVTPVIAQPFPEFMWDNAAANYNAAPLDGGRPAIFQMPLRPNELTLFSKRSLVYHETVPGHHFQLALIAENPEMPRFMQMRAYGGISAITEGWALYAERLAAESGWYDGDIEGHLGQLDSALFRARRLVVDTGLHTQGWTRQQAIDYGIPPSEVERYVVRPGQACAYMIGQLKIVELRERARTTLGTYFSIQDYHNVVLGAGVVPLTMLETIVDDYIAYQQSLHL